MSKGLDESPIPARRIYADWRVICSKCRAPWKGAWYDKKLQVAPSCDCAVPPMLEDAGGKVTEAPANPGSPLIT